MRFIFLLAIILVSIQLSTSLFVPSNRKGDNNSVKHVYPEFEED